MNETPGLGTIVAWDAALFIRSDVLRDGENVFEIGSTPTGLPVVRCAASGKALLLLSEDLLELAKRAGLHLADKAER